MCAPDPPNYAKAAAAQGAANVDAARVESKLNNPDIVNPYGTQTVRYGVRPKIDPATGAPVLDKNGQPVMDLDSSQVTQTFSPEQQALYDRQVATKMNLGDLGISGSDALRGVIGQNLDLSGAPAAPGSAAETRNKVIDAMMGRVNEDTANQRESKSSELIASGIRPGTKAYADAMNIIDRQYNDARDKAIVSAGQEAQRDYGMDQTSRKDAIAEILTQRQTPLNEVSALISGSQVNNPFAGNLGFQAGANVAPAPVMQGAINQGNYDSTQYGNMLSGLFNLGAAGVKAVGGF